MDTRPFSPSEAITFGWRVVKRDPSVFVGLAVLQFVVSSLEGSFSRMPHGTGGLAHLLMQAAGLALAIGWWRIALRAHDGQAVSLAALTELTGSQFLQYFVTTVLYGIAIAVGLLLLVLPGLVWAARFAFAPALVVDEGRDPLAAMRRSYELTEGMTVELFVFALYLLGLNLVGLLALGIGLAVTVPITSVAAAHVFRRLQTHAAEHPHEQASPTHGDDHLTVSP